MMKARQENLIREQVADESDNPEDTEEVLTLEESKRPMGRTEKLQKSQTLEESFQLYGSETFTESQTLEKFRKSQTLEESLKLQIVEESQKSQTMEKSRKSQVSDELRESQSMAEYADESHFEEECRKSKVLDESVEESETLGGDEKESISLEIEDKSIIKEGQNIKGKLILQY